MKPFPILVAVVTLFGSFGVISWMSRPDPPETSASAPGKDFSENPFAIPESGPHPSVVLEEEQYDFGKMILGETGRHAFVVRNEGEAPLKLKRRYSTCKCTVPTVPEGEIPPGESTQIVLEWDPQSPETEFSQYATIWTNDPAHEEITLQITGEIRELLNVYPPLPWVIGSVNEQEATTFEGMIASGKDSFNILSVESSADWLTADVQPANAEDLKESGNSSGYRIFGTAQPNMNVGTFQETLTIHTDLEDSHEVVVRVVGTRSGPFSIIGRNWNGGDMTVRMGEVDPAEGKSVTLSLFAGREEQPLQIESIQAEPDIVEVSLVRDESFQAPVKEKYNLTFAIPAQTPPGRYDGQDQIDVTIAMNRPEMERIHLRVQAIVE